MKQDFQRIAIVNRGEAAMRLIHAVREFNREHDLALRTIALYTDPDRRAMFVREADEAVSLGPANFVDAAGQRKNTYLDHERLEHVLVDSRAEAVWVGWGFVAEQPDFADLCRRLGIVFIGPTADVMRRLGDKITSKRLAEEARVPVAPWSGGAVDSLEQAREQAEQIGFPLMVKATSGGGGRGIRKVAAMGELEEAFERARSEASKGFGDPTVFMERLVQGARHVEVQVIADHHGTAWAVGVRDCSVQRRHQKLIEESSSPVLTAEQEEELKDAAVRLCHTAGYTNAGTVEFLYDPDKSTFAFMEVNARLQVEHPVTESTTDLDLVKLQIRVARGEKLEGEPRKAWGHAIEVRLNAEDPDNGFAPAPGRIRLFRLPTGAGIRIDTGVEEGDTIPSEFDSMIAKIIARGRDRTEALSRLRRALADTAIVVQGGTTNKAFLLDLLSRPEVVEGRADVAWLDRVQSIDRPHDRPFGELALIQAAIEVYESEFDAERKVFLASAARGRPKLPSTIGRAVELRHGGNLYRLRVFRFGGSRYRIEVDGQRIDLNSEMLSAFERRLSSGGIVHRVLTMADGVDFLIEIDGYPHRVSRDDNGVVRSPAPAVVVALKVQPGDEVRRGDSLVVLEAMKLEMHVAAPFAGRVRQIDVAGNEQVDAGAPLMRLKPAAEGGAEQVSGRLTFDSLHGISEGQADLHARAHAILEELQYLVLGFDVDPATSRRLVGEYESISDRLPADDEELIEQENLLLTRFLDLCALSHREPEPEADLPVVIRRSAQESLFTYLRALHARGEGLSEAFLDHLRRALAHYGIESLDPSPELEEVLLWIHKSQIRVESQADAVISVLQRRLDHATDLAAGVGNDFRSLLDRLISTSLGRFPSVVDLAREVRYAYFDKPLFERARREVYEQAEEHLRYLASKPEAADRKQRLDALVDCPQPLMNLLSARYVEADPSMRELMLECMVRRYYRIRQLDNIRVISIDGHPMATGEYEHPEGGKIQVVTTFCEAEGLVRAGERMLPIIGEFAADHDVAIDFYVRPGDEPMGADEAQERMLEAVNAIPFPRRIRRIVTSVATAIDAYGGARTRYFTFRPADEGYAEETVHRGLHPMMGKRLQLWRLGNFDLERLPSAEDVYLFHGTAHKSPRDERLFALCEVRDLTPVRDDAGRITGLPHLERMLLEALAGIRVFQSKRKAHQRLQWNRVLLHVWPPLDLKPDELGGIAHKLGPASVGLGLEKVIVRARIPQPGTGELRDAELHIASPAGRGMSMEFREPGGDLISPLTSYEQTVAGMWQRGLHYPYEIIRLLTPEEGGDDSFPEGAFTEYDLDDEGHLVPVDRAFGMNTANVVVGVVSNKTSKYPEGMSRVIVLGDPSRSLGSLAEAECSRIVKALDLAEERNIPLEWFAVSAGAKISMESGTENMDWIALVLRRLVNFTQAGGEVNIIVHGINVGAQPYWNAEATMLMHTRGILIMTNSGAMVLTGKRALDYSGGVSAEDNFGIGGYDRIMGPNGQAQYWAADIEEACRILLRHYDHTYLAAGEAFPRAAATADPGDRDIRSYPYRHEHGSGFATVGEVFSHEKNPGRKKPFDIRAVMMSVIDQDHAPLERWAAMRDAEIAVVWDSHVGGYPVCLIGLESRPLTRAGFVPADGPEQWTAGTLFPQSSKKMARALNAASGNRPVVILANLSGFDGSPESLRLWQLEYGAEIGRAVVNFSGPLVFCVISRYHGGAFVVFSSRLNDDMEVAALEGTHASVIGGAPAAAVVFSRDVDARTKADPRLEQAGRELGEAAGADRGRLRSRYQELFKSVRSEKLGEVAEEFDGVHSIHRALKVGSVDKIVPPAKLRSYLIDAVERGMRKTLKRRAGKQSTAGSKPMDHEQRTPRKRTGRKGKRPSMAHDS